MSLPLALLVLTRDPAGEVTGRKAVLATAASSLEALGWRVEAAVVSRGPVPSRWEGRRVHHLRPPSLPLILAGAARALLSGARSLNEVLFDDRRVRAELAATVADGGVDLVVADGLRTAALAMMAGRPVVAHLDDLLSDRYDAMRAAPRTAAGGTELLGFYAGQLPRSLRPPAAAAARRLLRREAAVVRRREVAVARAAAATAVTSPAEAAVLAGRAGVRVLAAPMAVDVDPRPSTAGAAPTHSAVFLGWGGYAPNVAALRWWRDSVRPHLDAAGGAEVVLTVVGSYAAAQQAELADDRLRFAGYVDDLATELRRHRVMVAPITAGAGLKTKVLDGMAQGLPVVATTLGVGGLTVTDGQDAWVADDPVAFAGHVLVACRDGVRAQEVGEAGRVLLAATWSHAALTARWAELLAWALPAGRPSL